MATNPHDSEARPAPSTRHVLRAAGARLLIDIGRELDAADLGASWQQAKQTVVDAARRAREELAAFASRPID